MMTKSNALEARVMSLELQLQELKSKMDAARLADEVEMRANREFRALMVDWLRQNSSNEEWEELQRAAKGVKLPVSDHGTSPFTQPQVNSKEPKSVAARKLLIGDEEHKSELLVENVQSMLIGDEEQKWEPFAKSDQPVQVRNSELKSKCKSNLLAGLPRVAKTELPIGGDESKVESNPMKIDPMLEIPKAQNSNLVKMRVEEGHAMIRRQQILRSSIRILQPCKPPDQESTEDTRTLTVEIKASILGMSSILRCPSTRAPPKPPDPDLSMTKKMDVDISIMVTTKMMDADFSRMAVNPLSELPESSPYATVGEMFSMEMLSTREVQLFLCALFLCVALVKYKVKNSRLELEVCKEARALLGRCEYRKGNIEDAFQVYEGIDIAFVIPKMKISIPNRCEPNRQ